MRSSEVARRMLDRDARAPRKAVKSAAEALQHSCTRVTDSLCRSLGAVGSSALLERAFARTAKEHPVIKEMYRRDGDSTRVDGITRSVEAHGNDVVTRAIEALLTAVIDLLTRLVGEEMATRLISGDEVQRSTEMAPAP